nr:hypothetical protein [Tanacetum cinerariifolium]
MLVQHQAPVGEGDSPRCQETTLGDTDAQTRFETASKQSYDLPLLEVNTSGSRDDIMEHQDDLTDVVPPTPHDSPLSGGHTPGSDEGRPNLIDLMSIYTQLSSRVLALEKAKNTQDKVITRLKLRVRRLKKKRKARTSQPIKRRLFKGRVETSTNKSLGKDASKQGRNDDKIEELNLTDGADTEVLVKDKGSGEKGGSTANQVSTARQEVSTATPSTPPTTTIFELDRAQKERQKQEEATIVTLTEEFDEIQARMDKETMAAKRVEEIRNKPPKRTHVRNNMITYLKHMDKEETVDPEILSTKYPIVDWEYQILKNVDTKDVHVYKIIKANGNTSYHKSLSSMLRKFDRQDLMDLHRLVMKRFEDNTLEEKRYPLIKEMLENMLNWKLEAKGKSTMAFELLKFIKSQVTNDEGNAGVEVSCV